MHPAAVPCVSRGRGQEEHGAIPSWHRQCIHVPALLGELETHMNAALWGNPPGHVWGQHLSLGCDPGKDNPPRLGVVDGASSNRGVWCDLPTPPLPPQRHPVLFYLFQSIISTTVIIFLPPLPSQHQARFSVYRRDSANTKGEMSVLYITRFSPNVTWGYRFHTTLQQCSAACTAMATDLSQLLLQTFPSRGPFAMDTSNT